MQRVALHAAGSRWIGRTVATAALGLLAACAGGGVPPVVDPADWQIASVTPLPDSGGESARGIIHFINGRDLATGLFAPRVLGTLAAVRKAPFVVLAGRDCLVCGEAEAVYVGSPSDGPLSHRAGGPFPGRQLDPETHELLFTSRLFVGRCLDATHDAAIWFYRDIGKGASKNGAYFIRIVDDKIVAQDLPEGAPATAARPRLASTEALAGVGVCTEIIGREQALQ
jgi:hypothetical protein